MMRAAPIALALSFLLPASPGFAKGGPRTLSDYNIQKEYLGSGPTLRARYFNGMTTRIQIGARSKGRGFFPGQTRYPTVRMQRAR